MRARLTYLFAVAPAFFTLLAFSQTAEDTVHSNQTEGLAAKMPAEVTVTISTALGDIVIALDRERAPKTVANFLRYVEVRMFDGGFFHRTVTLKNQPDDAVKIEVIQAAGNPSRENELFPPIALETTKITGLTHKEGTISMAREGPNTATDEFFICLSDQPELDSGGKRNPDDQGFAAFGRVVRGMNTVRKIHEAPAVGQRLKQPVKILSIRRSS